MSNTISKIDLKSHIFEHETFQLSTLLYESYILIHLCNNRIYVKGMRYEL